VGAGSVKKRALTLWISGFTNYSVFELDELWWFIKGRKSFEKGINTYLTTMVSAEPRQIVGFNVDNSLNSDNVQSIIDSVKLAQRYSTDGGSIYLNVDWYGEHNRNDRNKKDTHNVESVNADLRHYIAGLRRKSRCFFRKLETMRAVLTVFINAYNKFGQAKYLYRLRKNKPVKEFPFSHLNFISYG
jgi:hypothetical protein